MRTVLAAAIGIVLVVASTVFARLRVTEFMDRALEREAEDASGYLGVRVEDVLAVEAEALSGRGARPELANPRTWERSFDSVVREVGKFPGFIGLGVRTGGRSFASAGFAPYGDVLAQGERVRLDSAGTVLSRVRLPGATHVEVVLARTSQQHLEERRRLLDFVAFVPVAVAVAAWVVVLSFWYFGRGVRRVIETQRRSAARLAVMSEAARGIAHEVRNPMNAVSLTLQFVERYSARNGRMPEGGEFRRVHQELDQVNQVVDGFVRLARAEEMELAEVRLEEILFAAGACFDASSAQPLLMAPVPQITVRADKARLVEVLRVLWGPLHPAGTCEARPEIRVDLSRNDVAIELSRKRSLAADEQRRSSPLLAQTLVRLVLEVHGGSFTHSTDDAGYERSRITLPLSR